MDIDLGKTVVIRVHLDGRTHELREPTVADVKSLNTDNEGDSTDAFMSFVCRLGMPEDVAKSMGVMKLRKLSEEITGGIQKAT